MIFSAWGLNLLSMTFSKTLLDRWPVSRPQRLYQGETRYVGRWWLLTPSQPIRLYYQGETQFISSQVTVFSKFQIFHSLFGETEVEWTEKAEISKVEALTVNKACYARLYSYSMLEKGTFDSPGLAPNTGLCLKHPTAKGKRRRTLRSKHTTRYPP